ncbi:hypothetical protein Bca52824_021105 [Brassica carinata]|uniref:Polygalacturonase n=1 Tax=Brassica carinata TaxID=52824 RepID=A0A8X7VWB5_BRACI|nr:hypothetical protein Bca52824_021105 [Brassica carinata]
MIYKTSCLLLLPLALIFLDFILISSLAKPTPVTSLNVLTYGAKPDGSKDSTKAFLAAWEVACASAKPTTIIVPEGRFLVGNLVFQGKKCTDAPISIRIAGSIIAPEDYKVIASSRQWILFDGVTNVSIYGGLLDAQGSSLWKCKNDGGKNALLSLLFDHSNNITINGLKSINSQKFHIVIDESNNVNIHGVEVSADADSPNTDGIHIDKSHSVNITNSRIGTGDDCISIGPGSTYVSINGIQCGPGHGISIGSLGRSEDEQGVQNVMVSNVDFTSTDNGVRIKTWGKDSKSFVRNIVFQHIKMKMVKNPIIIDQHYCLDKPCPKRYEDIQGTSKTEVAVKLDCSKEKPCTDIVMERIGSYRNVVVGPAVEEFDLVGKLLLNLSVDFTAAAIAVRETDQADSSHIPQCLNLRAKPDGSKDSTKAFLAAWEVACASAKPTTIIVPEGRFLVGNLVFQGKKCTDAPISIRIAGSIIAPEDYKVIASSRQWILFDGVTNVSIYGGLLDAQGSSLWKCKNNGGKNALLVLSIGSLGRSEDEQGVENVMVSNVDFTSTDNGVRIKTWGKDSKSFVRNIVFQHIKMKMVKNPIIIDQHYCLDKPCPKKESGVEISNVRYEDIQGTSKTEVAVKLDCSKEKPCTDIVMGNVNLAWQMVNGSAQASCNNANGLAKHVVVPFTPCLKRDLLLT